MEKGRILGHRFESGINNKVESVLQIYEATLVPDAADSETVRSDKLQKKQRLVNYRSTINPEKAYNYHRKSAEVHHAKDLTIEALEEFLNSTGWTAKFFWELCLDENSSFSPEQCYRCSETYGWTELGWPNETMKKMAAVLDRSSEADIVIVDKYINELLPASYPWFRRRLEDPSHEFGVCRTEDGTECFTEYKETKLQNMGDRIYETIKYLSGDESDVEAACADAGIAYDKDLKGRVYRRCHYWIFSPKDIGKISKAFRLNPHWIVYGDSPQVLLAEKPETERLMDKFQFLPEEAQMFLMNVFCNRESNCNAKGDIL